MMDDFKLTNPPPKRRKLDVPNTTGTQKMLISGLDCLPAQLDLFETDGYDPTTLSPETAHDDIPRS